MESVTAPCGLARIPAATDLFVGRTTELDLIDAAVTGSGRAVVLAVHGLGGVGKTTVTARFAHQHTSRYAPVWWIPADSPTTLDTGLADLATALTPQTATLPLEQRTELALRWLATHDQWLLILDNVTQPSHVAPLLDRVRTGTIVITSRHSGGWRGIETIRLDVLPPGQAVELLTRLARADWAEADLTGAEQLCDELGWLPLAIEQAGAYLAQTRTTPHTYLNLLQRYPAQMFNATTEARDAQRTMARVWHLTLDQLTDTPLAGHLLRQLAWYAPDHIPRHLLTTGAAEPDLLHALGRLAAYSMIALNAETISVHRVVQAVTRTPRPQRPPPPARRHRPRPRRRHRRAHRGPR